MVSYALWHICIGLRIKEGKYVQNIAGFALQKSEWKRFNTRLGECLNIDDETSTGNMHFPCTQVGPITCYVHVAVAARHIACTLNTYGVPIFLQYC